MTNIKIFSIATYLAISLVSSMVVANESALESRTKICEAIAEGAKAIMRLRLENITSDEIVKNLDPKNKLVDTKIFSAVVKASFETYEIDTSKMSDEHKDHLSGLFSYEFLAKCHLATIEQINKYIDN